MPQMYTTPSVLKGFLTKTAVTYRSPIVGAQHGDHVEFLPCLHLSPLFPIDPKTKERMKLATQKEVLGSFSEQADVRRNDLVELNGRRYPVMDVAEWPQGDPEFLHLFLEDVKDAV